MECALKVIFTFFCCVFFIFIKDNYLKRSVTGAAGRPTWAYLPHT